MNRQNPFAGAAHDAVFNTWRRFYSQVFYWGPAGVIGYAILNWSIERYVGRTLPMGRISRCICGLKGGR